MDRHNAPVGLCVDCTVVVVSSESTGCAFPVFAHATSAARVIQRKKSRLATANSIRGN
jgi:hypothetical protein